jgi:hypothetical protein
MFGKWHTAAFEGQFGISFRLPFGERLALFAPRHPGRLLAIANSWPDLLVLIAHW